MTEHSEEETLDLFCNSCAVQVETRVVGVHYVTDPDQFVVDPESDPIRQTGYTFSVCKRCGAPFLTRQRFLEVPGEFTAPQDEPVLLYPSTRDIGKVPETVARAYAQAVVAFRAGLFEPCAIMCRKCLEGVCHELGATGNSLFKRLQDMRSRKLIDDKLLQWSDGLRIIGNDAAHDLAMVVEKEDAADALEFAEALCVYVFSLDRRFQAFQQRRASKGKPP